APDGFADAGLRCAINGTGDQFLRTEADHLGQLEPMIFAEADKIADSDMTRQPGDDTTSRRHRSDRAGDIMPAFRPDKFPHSFCEPGQPFAAAHRRAPANWDFLRSN